MNQNNNSLNNIFKSGMFTSTPQKEPTPSPFGSSQSNANVFGAPQQTFGSSNIFQPTQQTPFGQQNTNSSFGTSFFTTPKPQGNVFGALGSSGAVQPLPAPTNSFGAQPATSTGFGTASNPFGSSTAFGSTPTPTTNTFGTSNTFGSTTPFGTTTGTFGSAPTSTSTFGTTTAQNQTGWTTPSTFGSTTPSSFSAFQTNNLSIGSMKNGTRDTPYQDTRVKDGIGSIDIKHINAMNEYLRKSNDELRNEDYNLGRKAITSGNQPSATNSVFGSTPFSSTGNNMGVNISSSTNPFSNAQPSSTPFSTPFNTTTSSTPFNTTTSSTPFNTTTTSTPFNITTNNTTTNNTTTSTTPFNTTTNTNTIPFGITSNPFNNTQTAPSPFAVPGNTPQQPFASSTPQSSNPFGTSSQSTTFSNNSTLNSTLNSSNFSNTINCNPTNTMNYNPTNMNPSSNFTTNTFNTFTVNYEDPFLLKDITFEKVEKKTAPFSRIVPKPIFSEATMKPLLNLTYRPPRVTQKKKIYTEPSIEEARHLKEIENLVIGFEGKGRIQYIDKISGTELTTSNIEDKITFLKNEVVVSDPPGIGLNKRARVYVEGIFAFSKSQGDFIVGKAEKYPLKAIQERFVYSLKEDPYKKFVDYNYETGLYVYEVNHF